MKIKWKNLITGQILLGLQIAVAAGIGVKHKNIKDTSEITVDKPMIYVYPTAEMGDTQVSVKLTFDGTLTTTYPEYDSVNGWSVIASPDGTLKETPDGREYYGLYWEGIPNKAFTFTEGNMVAGSDTAEFLETSLKTLGLTDKEAQEFIVYWLPKMQNNTYNFIQFQTSQYTDLAKLDINPVPDTLIRVFMTYRPYESIASYKIQDLSKIAVQRQGYTVVEWGGSMI